MFLIYTLFTTFFVVPRYNDIHNFLEQYKINSPHVEFYRTFPDVDTSKPVPGIVGFLGYTEENILFLIECSDSIKPVSGSKGYDESTIANGDYISFVISPFESREFAYVFISSPSGGQYDYILTERGYSGREWDGLWKTKTWQQNKKWFTLFLIPFKTIFYNDSIFYIKASRNYYLSNTAASTNYNQPVSGLENMLEIVFHDFHRSPKRIHSDMVPYIRIENLEGEGKNLQGGGYFELKPNDLSLFSIAYNPDFSTVDADVKKLALSVEPYYYPEKRKFFIEGANAFSFELPLYYSRALDTIQLGVKTFFEKTKYSLYGIYVKKAKRKEFTGLGFNGYSIFQNLSPYLRLLKDDTATVIAGGTNIYYSSIQTAVKVESALNTLNSNKGFYIGISRNTFPGFSINSSFTSIDNDLITSTGHSWYNNTKDFSTFASYQFFIPLMKNWRGAFIFFYRNLKRKNENTLISNEKNLRLQVITPGNLYSSLGVEEYAYTPFGTTKKDNWRALSISLGKIFRIGSFSFYYVHGLKENNNLFTLDASLNIFQSVITFSLSHKTFYSHVQNDTTIFQIYGEIPVTSRIFIKPYICVNYSEENSLNGSKMDINFREFYYINRFSQIALVQDISYDLLQHTFDKKNFLFRFQYFMQLF